VKRKEAVSPQRASVLCRRPFPGASERRDHFYPGRRQFLVQLAAKHLEKN